ncbi:unnamed protein product [Onchocerca flexuosa]|uniref:Uncharacterized protein n=1 Tax=Onchocerca flexuosa TaxID=387005 RepID=A0A183HV19_9BILA|nr:unnamed protein product [Onchocerca flexuosa]
MQNCLLGTLVFPTRRSDIILDNPSLLHYGSYNKNTSSDNRKSHYSEERSRDSTNSSDPTGDNSSFYHHFSNTIFTNATGKLSKSAEPSQQYSRTETGQQKTKIDEKQKQNLFEKQKVLIHQTGNSSENAPETAVHNEPKSKSIKCNRLESLSAKTAHLMRATENELTGQELSNLPEVSKPSKFSEVEITSTSFNASKLNKNSYSSDNQPNLQHYRYDSKLSPPDNTMKAKRKIIEAINQQRPENEQYMSDFSFDIFWHLSYFHFFEIFKVINIFNCWKRRDLTKCFYCLLIY